MWYHLPCSHVPDSDLAVAASADKSIIPWHHSPHSHNMSLQRLLVATISVEDMNLGVIQSHNNILWREMQAGDYALILSDVFCNMSSTILPCILDQVALLEIRLMRPDLWPSHHLLASCGIEAARMASQELVSHTAGSEVWRPRKWQ